MIGSMFANEKMRSTMKEGENQFDFDGRTNGSAGSIERALSQIETFGINHKLVQNGEINQE